MSNTTIKTKQTAIPWLGEIPESWEIQRLYSVIKKTKNGAWGAEPKDDNNDIICIRVADFDNENYGISEVKLTTRNIDDSGNLLLNNGDLIFEKSGGGDNQLVGRVVIFNKSFKAVTSNFLATIQIEKDSIDNQFLFYVFKYFYNVHLNYKSIKQTTGIQNIDSYQYFQERFAKPPLQTQKKIASYLDDKTAKIKKLIDDKKKMIELLKEQKQSIIHEAVTKGIEKNVKMKDSGVAWLGEIPEGWEVRKLRTVVKSVQTGSTPENPSDNPAFIDGKIPWYSPGDFRDSLTLKNETEKMINTDFIEEEGMILYEPKTVFIIGIGATLGKFAISLVQSTSNQQLNAITFSEEILPFFGLYYFNSMKDYVYNSANSATLPILNQTQTKNLLIVKPLPKTQKEIITHIEKESNKINTAISKIEQEIELIEEYKKSLVYHAVTGKISKLI